MYEAMIAHNEQEAQIQAQTQGQDRAQSGRPGVEQPAPQKDGHYGLKEPPLPHVPSGQQQDMPHLEDLHLIPKDEEAEKDLEDGSAAASCAGHRLPAVNEEGMPRYFEHPHNRRADHPRPEECLALQKKNRKIAAVEAAKEKRFGHVPHAELESTATEEISRRSPSLRCRSRWPNRGFADYCNRQDNYNVRDAANIPRNGDQQLQTRAGNQQVQQYAVPAYQSQPPAHFPSPQALGDTFFQAPGPFGGNAYHDTPTTVNLQYGVAPSQQSQYE
ncbi:uncharacterized protein M437DRAFT_66523 [Aureobasidium melanogenum CBS 110374]|uniref:Uncharacterized protein n=1 Tax=Aureobasidium melanogenum (strain CBS 110374) TaxID=1043003 RepID=A0A074VMX5_AURM1|nr:uncharacterized protein M437DRAFT_66523 [Aureobasidium melanogenum CBS 110374]KEQ62075.1 hypothetical protein M437DRAFT_66523 [Aureobasidium melanogenum CBS 110374]